MISKTKKDILSCIFYITSFIRAVGSIDQWSFPVLTDWHGAEYFAKNPGNKTKVYVNHLEDLKHVKQILGGDLLLCPGDTNNGLWYHEKYIDQYKPHLSVGERVYEMGRNCYDTTKSLFTESGYPTALVAIGDHEMGDNGWWKKGTKVKFLPEYRKSFIDGFNKDSEGRFRFRQPIGSVGSRPMQTSAKSTSHAYRHKNVLFITVDVFKRKEYDFYNRKLGLGGEGVVTCSVTGRHLLWFESVLIEAGKDTTIKHIVVQSHIPIMEPVRKILSSGQFFDKGESSAFWKTMVKYKVDIYFAGEVHAVTASRDSSSNLIQIVSRANELNNLLNVEVTDEILKVTAYNELLPGKLGNREYAVHGSLVLDKSGEHTVIRSEGVLELLDRSSPLIHLTFDNIVPMSSRQVLGFKQSKKDLIKSGLYIRGIWSNESLSNEGSFGQQYDAQVANIALDPGFLGNSGIFVEDSRLSIYSLSPHSGGGIVSYALWFSTSQESEVILLHNGNMWDSKRLEKDDLILTLKNGTPILYTDTDVVLEPQAIYNLNDNEWHHIAVSMPEKSCLLSEVAMYIDGNLIQTFVPTKKDRNIFFSTIGIMSIGGFGHSSIAYENDYPHMSPLIGKVDEVLMWSRTLLPDDLISAMRWFKSFEGRLCVGARSNLKNWKKGRCRRKCEKKLQCRGYETSIDENGLFGCTFFHAVPILGEKSKTSRCSIQQ